MKGFERIWRRIADSRLSVLESGAGHGPGWAIWLVMLCGALAAIAWVSAVIDVLHGASPRQSFLILFGAIGLVAIPLWCLRLRVPATCVAAIALAAVPFVWTVA